MSQVDFKGLRAAATRTMFVLCLALIPFMYVLSGTHAHAWLEDFRGDFYGAGHAILHGHDPYAATDRLVTRIAAARQHGLPLRSIPVTPSKPAPVLLAAVPFALLHASLSGVLLELILVVSLLAGLRLLEVHDWRCYAIALISAPTLLGVDLGNLSPLLVIGLAMLWRTRAGLLAPAFALSSVVLIKLFPWPLGLWLLFTRRFTALLLAVALTLSAAVLGWAVIGFADFTTYPHLLSQLDQALRGSGVSTSTWLLRLGLPSAAATAIALAIGGVVMAIAWRLAAAGLERHAFAVAVVGALVLAPQMWDHYLIVLFVPIALISPGPTALWLVPELAYPFPDVSDPLVCLIAEAVVLWAILRQCGWLRLRPAAPGPAGRVIARR